jgi:hypothetical protein
MRGAGGEFCQGAPVATRNVELYVNEPSSCRSLGIVVVPLKAII